MTLLRSGTEVAAHVDNVTYLPWPDDIVEEVAKHLWHCTSTRHKLPWSELPEMVKRGARNEARVIEEIVRTRSRGQSEP